MNIHEANVGGTASSGDDAVDEAIQIQRQLLFKLCKVMLALPSPNLIAESRCNRRL